MKKSVYYLLLLLLMGTGSARAQVTTMGTDFWAGFMMNYKDTVSDNFFMISAFRDCSVQITSSDGSYDTLVHVTADAPLNVHIPFDYCNTLMDFGGVTNKSLHVVATDTISLYAGSFLSASFDMTGVLPIPALGSGYILQTYESLYDSYFANFGAEFLVVATEDSTTLRITPSYNITDSSLYGDAVVHAQGEPYYVTLHRGQCLYETTTRGEEADFSGTLIESLDDKPVAVFQGNTCSNIPSGFGACDHLYEQSIPINAWGSQFVVMASLTRTNDILRITSSSDNNQISINGDLFATLSQGQTIEYDLNQAVALIESTRPISVFLYLVGGQYGGQHGDPASVVIHPVQQVIEKAVFCNFQTELLNDNYVNISTRTPWVEHMQLDGRSIASQFHTVPYNPNLSYARLGLTYGNHIIECPHGGFNAHIYGLGEWESYACALGASVVPMLNRIDSSVCSNHLPVDWYGIHFEDADSITIPYPVPSIFDSLTLVLTVNPAYENSVEDSLPPIGYYRFMDTIFYDATFYEDSSFTAMGCDSVNRLTLHYKERLWVPNVFTPDALTNNVFQVVGKGINTLECTIYDRRGRYVYSWQGLDGSWDGTQDGHPLPMAGYVYFIRYSSIDEPKSFHTKAGIVTLIR